MEIFDILRAIFALVLVLAFIGITYFIIRKYIPMGLIPNKNLKIKIEEILHIDQKRKIVSIKRENKTYILLVGNTEQLIEIIPDEKV